MTAMLDAVARAFAEGSAAVLLVGAVAAALAFVVARPSLVRDAGARAAVWTAAIGLGLLAPFVVGRLPIATAVEVVEDEVAVRGATEAPRGVGLPPGRRTTRETHETMRPPGVLRVAGESWPRAALLLWLPWAALGVVQTTRALRRLAREKRSATPAGVRLDERVRVLAARSGVRRPVDVGLVDGAAPPRLAGGRRPRILLPRSMAGWTGPDLDAVLLHELAHAARGDDVQVAVLRLVESLLPFAVPLRIAARRLDEERELACDDHAARVLGSGRPLARALAAAAWTAGLARAAAPHATPTPGRLARRIRRLARRAPSPSGGPAARRLPAVVFLAAALAATLPLPGVRVVAEAAGGGVDRRAVRYALEEDGVRVAIAATWSGTLPDRADGRLVLEDGVGADRFRLELRAVPGEGVHRAVRRGGAPAPFDAAAQGRLERVLASVRADLSRSPSPSALPAALGDWGLPLAPTLAPAPPPN